MSSTLYLTFTASSHCVDQYVLSIGLTQAVNAVHSGPFGTYEKDKFGWVLSSPCNCRFYFDGSSVLSLYVAVKLATEEHATAYMIIEQ